MHDELNIDSQGQPHLGTMFSPVLDKQWPFNKYLLNKGNFGAMEQRKERTGRMQEREECHGNGVGDL